MADPQNGAPTEDGISSLLREIRGVKPHSDNPRHRHFTNQDGHRPNNGYGQNSCQCGAKKFPSAPRCPTCAYEAGLIDQRTMQSLLNALSGEQPLSNYGSTRCQCSRSKLANTSQCKPCAVQRGVLEISVEPGEEPCPNCGDGKKPPFTYCTGCAMAEGYIDRHGQVSPNCPMDDCQCGNTKYAAYSQCSNCARGITGYRHQDWTTGPNPVRIFKPLPTATPPEGLTNAPTPVNRIQNTAAATDANTPEVEVSFPAGVATGPRPPPNGSAWTVSKKWARRPKPTTVTSTTAPSTKNSPCTCSGEANRAHSRKIAVRQAAGDTFASTAGKSTGPFTYEIPAPDADQQCGAIAVGTNHPTAKPAASDGRADG